MKLVRSLTELGVTIVKVGSWQESGDEDNSLFEGETVLAEQESKTMRVFNLGPEHSSRRALLIEYGDKALIVELVSETDHLLHSATS